MMQQVWVSQIVLGGPQVGVEINVTKPPLNRLLGGSHARVAELTDKTLL